jgi:hypothetical protein
MQKHKHSKMAVDDDNARTLFAGNFFCDFGPVPSSQSQRGILRSKTLQNVGLQICVQLLCGESNLYLVRANKLTLPRLLLPDI